MHRTLKQIEHSARCGDKQMQHAQILDVETAWHRTRALMLDQI
jgi:hypothetical protein